MSLAAGIIRRKVPRNERALSPRWLARDLLLVIGLILTSSLVSWLEPVRADASESNRQARRHFQPNHLVANQKAIAKNTISPAAAWFSSEARRSIHAIQNVEVNSPAAPGRLMMVHFWATWCSPCMRELQSLEAFYTGPYRALRAKGMRLVTVNNDVRVKDLLGYLVRNHSSFPVYYDSLLDLNEQFDMVGLPGTVLIDRQGRILERMVGVQDWGSSEFLARIEAHLQHQTNSLRPTGG